MITDKNSNNDYIIIIIIIIIMNDNNNNDNNNCNNNNNNNNNNKHNNHAIKIKYAKELDIDLKLSELKPKRQTGDGKEPSGRHIGVWAKRLNSNNASKKMQRRNGRTCCSRSDGKMTRL